MIAILALVLFILGMGFLFFYMVYYQTFVMMNDTSFSNENYITYSEFVSNMEDPKHNRKRPDVFPTSLFSRGSDSELHAGGIKFDGVQYRMNFPNYTRYFIWKVKNVKKVETVDYYSMRS